MKDKDAVWGAEHPNAAVGDQLSHAPRQEEGIESVLPYAACILASGHVA